MTSYKQRIEEILSKYQLYRSIMAEELLVLMDEFGDEAYKKGYIDAGIAALQTNDKGE